jgi:ketosteroid isomerase-like protein
MKIAVLPVLFSFAIAPAIADVADEVRCREISFSKSVEHQDLEAFRAFIDTDARFVGASVSRGVDAVATAWTVFFKEDGPMIKWRPQIIEVLADGKLALSRGLYRVRSPFPNGDVVEEWGTFNSVWRLNDDGEWRVVFDAGSEAATEPDDATKALLDADSDCP